MTKWVRASFWTSKTVCKFLKISKSGNCRCIFGPHCFPVIQCRLCDVSLQLCHASIKAPHESEKWILPSEMVIITLTIYWLLSVHVYRYRYRFFLGGPCFRWLKFALHLDPFHCSTKPRVWAWAALCFSKLRLHWSAIMVWNRPAIDMYFIWPHFKKPELSL